MVTPLNKEEINKTTIKVTEIPIGFSIDSFKEKLDDALEKKIITSYLICFHPL